MKKIRARLLGSVCLMWLGACAPQPALHEAAASPRHAISIKPSQPLSAYCAANCPDEKALLDQISARKFMAWERGTCGTLRYVMASTGYTVQRWYFSTDGHAVTVSTFDDTGRAGAYGEAVECVPVEREIADAQP